ncbi:MAG: nickel-dependent lactate racemase [Promethearchaeota archaeon]
MKVKLPYGKKELSLTLPDDIKIVEIHGNEVETVDNPEALLQEAVENPIGNVPPLEDLVEGKKKIVVVVDDYTRAFPRDAVLIPFFDLLEEMGVDKKSVTIIIGTGTHKKPDDVKIEQVLGDRLPKEYKVLIHDCRDKKLVNLGKTSFGTPIKINKTYMDSDCKILLTDTTFHYYAGFGGDRKSILPAVSGVETINHNHGMLIDPNSKTGNIDGNPVHLDMMEVAKAAGADFVINVLARGKEVIDIKAGEQGVAFSKTIAMLKDIFEIPIQEQADLIIVSAGGYPKDINLYQGTKGITHTKDAVKQGGHVVYLAECADGIGHAVFEEWIEALNEHIEACKDEDEVTEKACEFLSQRVKNNFIMGGHKAFYLFREKSHAGLSLLSSLDQDMVKSKYHIEPVKFTSAKTMAKSFQTHVNKKIKELKPKMIYVIPHGGAILVSYADKMGQERKMIRDIKNKVSIGPPFITKYEKSRIVGARALQIALGAPPMLSDEYLPADMTEPIDIAEIELKEKVLPIIIRRILPSREFEDYPIDIFSGDAMTISKDIFIN